MFKDCVEKFQCVQIAPAIRNMNQHFEQRKGFAEAVNMTIEMLQDTIPSQQESQIVMVKSVSKIIDVIWEVLLQPYFPKIIVSVFSTVIGSVVLIAIVIRLLGAVRFILTGIFGFLVILGIALYVSTVSGHSKEYQIIQDKIESLSKVCKVHIESDTRFSLILQMVRVTDNMHSFKNILHDSINYDKVGREDTQQSFQALQTLKPQLENVIFQLAERKYSKLEIKATEIYNKFDGAIKELKNTLKKSRRFYGTLRNAVKATIQSGEEIPLREILTFLRNTVDRSIEIHEEFEELRTKFNGLYTEVHRLREDIRKATDSNDDKRYLVKAIGAAVNVLAAIAAPHVYFPIVAVTSLAGGGYIVKNAKDDNDVLQRVKSEMTNLGEYSKKIAEIIDEFDAMKTATSINNFPDLKLDTEAYKYYMEDLLDVAEQNHKEIEMMIRKLMNIGN
eukprot:TCONS_00069309-protein